MNSCHIVSTRWIDRLAELRNYSSHNDSLLHCVWLLIHWLITEMWTAVCHIGVTCGFQVAICNTMNTCNAKDTRLATQSKKPKYAMQAHEKQCTQSILFFASVVFFVCTCIAYVAVSLICVAWPACVVSIALHSAAWKPTFKSVFIGLHAVSKLSHTTHAMQRMHGLQRNQKT